MRLSRAKASGAEIAKKLHTTEAYVSRRRKVIKRREKNQRRGVSKESLEECFKMAGFPEEQIQRILSRELENLLRRASIYRINRILKVLLSFDINREAIENSMSILVDGNPKNIEVILRILLVEYKISKEAVEGCLTVLSKGQENEIRGIFEVLLVEYKISKESIEGCLTVLSRGKANEIRGILEILLSDEHKISKEAIENCLSVLAIGKADEIRAIFEVLDEYKIRKEAIEGALCVLARGKAENIREIFKVLKENRIEKSRIESCLSILVARDADEVRGIFRILKDNGIDEEIINNSLYAIATGKFSEIEKMFEAFKRAKIEGTKVLRNGLKLLAERKSKDVEDAIATLQNNGVRNEIIEEELSALCNTSSPKEITEIFNDNEEPEDKDAHYINVRRYMKLKELYGKTYTREEVEKLCTQKHLTVKEFIAEVVTYPNGRNFTDIYYEKLMRDGKLYIGGSTDIDWDYQNEHGEELIRLSKRIANTFSIRTSYHDRAELESRALEIMLTKCGNLVYNLADNPDKLRAAMFNKTIAYLYSVVKETNAISLTIAPESKSGKQTTMQRDIPVKDNVQGEENSQLESSIDYKKAEFNEEETQVMQCMIRLVEERRSR